MDAAFLRTPIGDREGLVINPLLEEPMVAALPSAHLLAQNNGGRGATISMKALAGETFIVYGRPHKPGQHGLGQYEAMIAACRRGFIGFRYVPTRPRFEAITGDMNRLRT